MSYKLYFGVDVSKHWLDIAYYDGEDVDWQHGHIRVDNDEKGFKELGEMADQARCGKGDGHILHGVHRAVLSGVPSVAGASGYCLRDGSSSQDAPF